MQELESKFKDAYSKSLSNKDERIQVLEKRVEEMTVDNSQLRETLRKQSEKLKELSQANGESPAGSPSMKRMNSPREMSRLKEQAADAMKMRDRLHRVQEDVSFVVMFSLSLPPVSLPPSPLPPSLPFSSLFFPISLHPYLCVYIYLLHS